MPLLQEITESEVQKDVDMPCGIFPEGIADKAFPPDSTARRRCFYATVRVIYREHNHDGFVITAFMTSKPEKIIKNGVIWKR